MDQRRRHVRAAAIPVALLVLSFVGCARRPSGTHVSGPSPMGSASVSANSRVKGGVGNDTTQGEGDGRGTASGLRGREGAMRAGATGAPGGDAAMQDATQLGMMTAAAWPNPTQFSHAPGLPDIHLDFDR